MWKLFQTNVPPYQESQAIGGPLGDTLAISGLAFGKAQGRIGCILQQKSGQTFLNRPEAPNIQRACGPLCPSKLLLFNTPSLGVIDVALPQRVKLLTRQNRQRSI